MRDVCAVPRCGDVATRRKFIPTSDPNIFVRFCKGHNEIVEEFGTVFVTFTGTQMSHNKCKKGKKGR